MKKELPNVITIMWFQTFGHMKSIKVKSNTIKKLLYLAIFILVVTFISLSSNIYFLFSNKNLRASVVDLEKGIKNTKELCEFNKKTFFDYPQKDSKEPPTQVAEAPKPDDQPSQGVVSETVKVDPTTDSRIKISHVKKTIDFDQNIITLRFHLNHIKTDNQNSAISGYVVLMGRNEDIAEPVYITYPPNVKLNNAFPLDYRQGDPFYIKNLKIVKGKLALKKSEVPIKEIVIYVFSRVGELLLEKTVPIELGAE